MFALLINWGYGEVIPPPLAGEGKRGGTSQPTNSHSPLPARSARRPPPQAGEEEFFAQMRLPAHKGQREASWPSPARCRQFRAARLGPRSIDGEAIVLDPAREHHAVHIAR